MAFLNYAHTKTQDIALATNRLNESDVNCPFNSWLIHYTFLNHYTNQRPQVDGDLLMSETGGDLLLAVNGM